MSNQNHPARQGLTRRLLLAATAAAGAGAAWRPDNAAAATDAAALEPVSKLLPQRIYGNDAYPVWYRRPMPPETPTARYPGFNPGTKLLKAGTLRREGAMKLPCDIVFERDVAVKLRDGVTIYTDVFRPAAAGKYPAIIAWSPYGKEIGGQWFDDVPHRSGVPLSGVSELQKFEGPDPARFCAAGYVVINPDCRGAYSSEGNINFWGRQLAEDGYDVIEWAAAAPWSTGKIAMAGNSWLAISQWFIAAERPPHLTAIAPWEGTTSHYSRGGITDIGFEELIVQSFAGRNLMEDIAKMEVLSPLRNAYWDDKSARVERIEIPAYVVASYTNPAHTVGTFYGFRHMASKQKWLRVHNTNEWCDFNQPEHQVELLRFFDHFLKGADNGWEHTPPVRISVLDRGGEDIVNRVEASFPLPRQQLRPLYLVDDGALSLAAQAHSGTAKHAAEDGSNVFTIRFDQDTEITGYMALKLWVEAIGAEDMDIAVTVTKHGRFGLPVMGDPNTSMGPRIMSNGLVRASMRELDPAQSTPSEPVLALRRKQLLTPGQIVPVEISIRPMGMRYRAGESLVLTVATPQPIPLGMFSFGSAKIPVPRDGGTFTEGSDPDLIVLGGPPSTKPDYVRAQSTIQPPSPNAGTHVIHFGGQYDSRLLVPFIPA